MCDLIALSWNKVKARTLCLSQRKIIPEDVSTCTNTEGLNGDPTVSDFVPDAWTQHHCTDSEISKWLQSDEGENGFANLTKNEITSTVVNNTTIEDSDESDEPAFLNFP